MDEKDVLQQCKEAFEASAGSKLYLDYYNEAYFAERFNEGHHWEDGEREEISKSLGVDAVTVNKIGSRIRNAVGEEIQTRTKTVFRGRSGDPKEEETAQVLTDLDYFFQDTNRTPFNMSNAFKHTLIGGIGWYELEANKGTIVERSINPLNVVWDVSDTTPDLTEQNFVADYKWLTRAAAKKQFPEKGNEIDGLSNDAAAFTRGESISDYFTLSYNGSYVDEKFDKVCVVRMFYREPKTVYIGVTDDGRLFQKFNKKEAQEVLAKGQNLIEEDGYCVYVCWFSGSVLLDHYEYGYQLDPLNGRFPIFCIVGDREATTGIPRGIVHSAIDIQKMINSTETRLNWYMRSNQVIADADAVDNIDIMRTEVNRADGIILKRPNKELRIERHESKVQTHLARANSLDASLQSVLGIYDEQMGAQTNANSGIAIQRRQQGGTRNLTMFYDKLRQARLTRGKLMLPLMQQVLDSNRVFYITDDEGKAKALPINKPVVDENGKPKKDDKGRDILVNDVKTGMYDVYLEEVPEYSTQNEEWRQRALGIIEKMPMVIQNPALFKATAVLAGIPQNVLTGLMKDLGFGDGQQAANPQGVAGGAQPNSGQGASTANGMPNPAMMQMGQ